MGNAARSMRVLVADDNVDTVESTAVLLQLDGHEVEMAMDGMTCVQRAEAFRPELVLLDIGMPHQDGFYAARRIRQLASPNAPYLVAVTGWGRESDKRMCAEAGFDLHLLKPLDQDALRELVALLQTSERLVRESRELAIQNTAIATTLMFQQLEMANLYLNTAAITGIQEAEQRYIAHATRAHDRVSAWLASGACSKDRADAMAGALQALRDRLSQ